MECHRCRHREAVESGKFANVPYRRTPCARCELREVSLRTIEVDPDRPVFVPGHGVETAARSGMVPHPVETDEEEKLPVDVLGKFVGHLLALPRELRDVVCWRFMGMEYQEIGRKQRITTAGAEARHRRAMRLYPELRQLFIAKTARMKMRNGGAVGRIGG